MKNKDLKLGMNFTSLTIVKKLSDDKYECRCSCSTLEIIDKELLKNGTKKKCKNCKKRENKFKNINMDLYNKRKNKELYYIWIGFKELYKNPTPKFQKQIINKNIKFFPELKDNFKLFIQWAFLSGYGNNGRVFLSRKNPDKDFSNKNSYWSSIKNDSFVILPPRNI